MADVNSQAQLKKEVHQLQEGTSSFRKSTFRHSEQGTDQAHLADKHLLLQVSALDDRAVASEAAADKAEENASTAMRSAETGVREEMEAAAVVKETESALTKALQELTFLETSYEEKEFESKADMIRAKEKAQKEAQTAVKDALKAVNTNLQGPEQADGTAGQHQTVPDVLLSNMHNNM